MNKLERDLLFSVKEQLEKSTKTDWKYESFSNLKEWAFHMKDTINSACSTMHTIIQQPIKE